jgi:hypothetical protein
VRQGWRRAAETESIAVANVLAAFGFQQIGTFSGVPNFAVSGSDGGNSAPSPYRIAAGNATAIFQGDLVRMNVSGPTGYVEQWAAGDGGTTKIPVGIFYGCRYYSTSQKKTVWNNYWPGSDATGDVEAFICDDPQARFMCQAGAGPITLTALGTTADITATPVGNTTTGISGMSLANPASTVFLPFKVLGVVNQPPGVNGRDITTAFNFVVVAFSNQTFKSTVSV